jgi:hypothetical protein
MIAATAGRRGNWPETGDWLRLTPCNQGGSDHGWNDDVCGSGCPCPFGACGCDRCSDGGVRRARFAAGSDEVIAWLEGLPQPLRGCYYPGR